MLTDHDMQALESVRSCLRNVTTDVLAAQILLNAGRAVDLTHMEVRMERLCTSTLSLPPLQARATLPDLMALRETVDVLIETLTNGRLKR